MWRWPRTIKILISSWPRKRKFSQLFKNTGDEDLCLPWSGVGHPLHPIFMLWLVNISVEFTRKVYAASWNLFTLTAEADRVLCQLVMSLTVFFPWMYKMKYSCYQESFFIHGRFVYILGFWLTNASLVKVGNPFSDVIVFFFHLSWCVRGFKTLKRFWP